MPTLVRSRSPFRLRTRAFIHPLLLAGLTLTFTGATGLGVVWARQQITATAVRTQGDERQLAQTERSLAELNTVLTAEQTTPMLERRNAEWQLGLVPPREPQLVRVAAADERRFAALRDAAFLADFRPATPVASSAPALHLAVNLPRR